MKLQIIATLAGFFFYLAVTGSPGFVWCGTVMVLWFLDLLNKSDNHDQTRR